MLKVYGIKNCSSVKKALDLLTTLELSYEFHDYKKQGIDADTLKLWLQHKGQQLILNKKGTTWKKLSEVEQQHALANESNLIETLIEHSSLIKRPIIATGDDWIVGFNEDEIRALATMR